MSFHLFKNADVQSSHVCFAISDDKLLMNGDRLPTVSELKLDIPGDELVFRLSQGWALPGEYVKAPGLQQRPLRDAFDLLPALLAKDASLGAQYLNWSTKVRFCSQCGSKIEPSQKELAKACAKCKSVFYPQLTPAVIVIIRRGNQILLAKGLPPRKYYSCIAGFVEPGETLEDCIRREVREEVNIEVRNIKYFGSQPWPFPNNLMIGFTADWVAGEIKISNDEIVDAGWYTKDNLPELPPKASIARHLIESALRV